MTRKKIICVVCVLLIIGGTLFALSHKTYYKYNDWWIIGRSYREVKERYGKFDVEYEYRKAYYIGHDNSIIMPSHLPMYYWMDIDESGNITRVYIYTKPGG